jgi:hypothetical protein
MLKIQSQAMVTLDQAESGVVSFIGTPDKVKLLNKNGYYCCMTARSRISIGFIPLAMQC